MTQNAGRTNLPVGTRIHLTGIMGDIGDQVLVGATGSLVDIFPGLGRSDMDWVAGMIVDPKPGLPTHINISSHDSFNVIK